MAFDKRGLEDYVEVHERVQEFNDTYPLGRIQTQMLTNTDTLVVFKAYAYRTDEDRLPATGHSGMEKPGKTPYTRGSEIENCETSAVGRALAILGIKIKRSIASKDEIENKKEAEGRKEVEEKGEGGAEAPVPTLTDIHRAMDAPSETKLLKALVRALVMPTENSPAISPGDINDMLAALTSAAGIWGTDYVAGCLKTWAARPVPNIDKLGQEGAVDVALIDSLTENDHQVSKFHSRLKKLQKAVENARGAGA